MDFAREVAETVPPDWRVRLVVLDAHYAQLIRRGTPGTRLIAGWKNYFREHPEAWPEIAAVFKGVLAAKDARRFDRLTYGYLAYNAGETATAKEALADFSDEEGQARYGEEFLSIKKALLGK